MAYIDKGKMEADKYILQTRLYLDYLEEHIDNVRKAFNDLTKKCSGMAWVGDDMTWHTMCLQVEFHDLSKFSAEEFVQYRESFYPINDKEKAESDMLSAWEHHKQHNSHHHETAESYLDIIHMVIDWTAMGYKFGDTAQEYYEANKDKIVIKEIALYNFMYEIFDKIALYKED